jgi:hypothetical protein
MAEGAGYGPLADAVLTLHVVVVAFVVGGVLLIAAGNWRGWAWVNELAFRLVHLAAIAVVAAEAWLGITCPLTTLEVWLRSRARQATYEGGFVEHWLRRLLYVDAPPWVFVVAYSLFFLLVGFLWWRYPPRRGRRRAR